MLLKRLTMGIAALALAGAVSAQADETLKFGISAILSGPAVAYGTGTVWTAEQAAKKINDAGGLTIGGKTYKIEIIAYDNKYNAADGAKVAQTLINDDGVKFIVASMSTAAVSALQAISERAGVLHFTGAWGKRVKGKDFPMTFTQLNSPAEIFGPLYSYLHEKYPDAKTVYLINPNDASGQDVESVAHATWDQLGLQVVGSDFFDRNTTEFAPIATKIAEADPDILDLAATPLQVAGNVLKELEVLGWDGVKVNASGSSVNDIVTTGGAAANGTYIGLSADFSGPLATDIQRELNEKAKAELGQPLDQVTIMSWDSIAAIVAAMKATDSVDPAVVAAALPTLKFESSYGPSGFGLAASYGLPNQMLLPIIVSQIQDGKPVEIIRIASPELAK